MKEMVQRMKALAEKFHDGQFRKGPDKRPYITHPAAVVAMLETWGVTDPCALAAAWGHDLLEDTKATKENILAASISAENGFVSATVVSDIIKELTHKPGTPKFEYLHNLALYGSERARAIKFADRLCNTLDFVALGDLEYAAEYLARADELFMELDNMPEPLRTAIRTSLDEVERKLPAKYYTQLNDSCTVYCHVVGCGLDKSYALCLRAGEQCKTEVDAIPCLAKENYCSSDEEVWRRLAEDGKDMEPVPKPVDPDYGTLAWKQDISDGYIPGGAIDRSIRSHERAAKRHLLRERREKDRPADGVAVSYFLHKTVDMAFKRIDDGTIVEWQRMFIRDGERHAVWFEEGGELKYADPACFENDEAVWKKLDGGV